MTVGLDVVSVEAGLSGWWSSHWVEWSLENTVSCVAPSGTDRIRGLILRGQKSVDCGGKATVSSQCQCQTWLAIKIPSTLRLGGWLRVPCSPPLIESQQRLHGVFRGFSPSGPAYLGCVLFFSAYRDNQSFVAESEGKDRPFEGLIAKSCVNTSDVSM